MSVVPQRVLDIVAGLDLLKPVLTEIEMEWRPDRAPLTTSMGDVGRFFVESAEALSSSQVATVLGRIEAILCEGTNEEKDAVATGFLEAVASALDEAPHLKWILRHAGVESRRYLAAWDRFCGV